MISIVIPTRGNEAETVATLAALVPGSAAGMVRDVVLVDRGGGNGDIARVADVAGCRFLAFDGSRADASAAGVKLTRGSWLMFLHAGAVLESGWIDETAQFIESVSIGGRHRAGVFRYARSPYAEGSIASAMRQIARAVIGTSADQGLLIARDHYDRLGGYAPGARSAESKLLSKIGRSGRARLRTRIFVTA
ncbi:MAG: glycosyl transferase [Afipia felis]|nr:glycosyl transferase [Afipia felis]